MNILLGISGKPRSGKDSIANYLKEEHGFNTYSFADYLKWMCVEYFDYSKEDLWGPKTEESRKFLQALGKLLTDMDSDIFVNKTVDQIRRDYKESETQNKPFRAIIADVRREDEAVLFDRTGSSFLVYDSIMNSGVSLKNAFDKMMLIKVERPIEDILKEEPGLAKNIEHAIEQFPDTHTNWDYLISNSSDVPHLLASVDRMINELEQGANDDSSQ